MMDLEFPTNSKGDHLKQTLEDFGIPVYYYFEFNIFQNFEMAWNRIKQVFASKFN